MCNRVLSYYQAATEPGFASHMINEIGLSDRDKKIAWNFRKYTGSTEFYADLAALPLKTFNEISARIHRRMMDELLRLALIGWRYEQKFK